MSKTLHHLIAMARVTQARSTVLEQTLRRDVAEARKLRERLMQCHDAWLARKGERYQVALQLNSSHAWLATYPKPSIMMRNQISRLDADLAGLGSELRTFRDGVADADARCRTAKAALTKTDCLHQAVYERLYDERLRLREIREEDEGG
nr:hypothetical protein [Burkholderia ambifaria]